MSNFIFENENNYFTVMTRVQWLIFAIQLSSTIVYKVTEGFFDINFTFLFSHVPKNSSMDKWKSKIEINKSFCNFVENGSKKQQSKNGPLNSSGW